MIEKFISDGYFYKIIFSGVDYLPMYEFLYKVFDPYENSIFLYLLGGELGIYILFYFCFTVFLAFTFRGVRNLFGYKGFNFNGKQDLFHMFFLSIPIVNIIYGVIIGFSNLKIKEQFGPIIFGIIFWVIIFSLRGMGIYSGNTINIFYFFPALLLILFLWKPLKNYLQIGKIFSITLLFGLLFIQPLFTTWFLNTQEPLENKICYSREHARSGDRYIIVGSKCFKIFEGFALYPWMQPIGYTHDELRKIKNNNKLELLLQKQSQIKNPSSLDEDIKKAYRSILLSEFVMIIDDIGNKNSGFISKVRPFDRDEILKNYEIFIQTYGKDERVEYLYKEFIKNLKYLEK